MLCRSSWGTPCHLVSWVPADWQTKYHQLMLHISAIHSSPNDFFWKPTKLCMNAVLMIWCIFTGHFRVGGCELSVCKPLLQTFQWVHVRCLFVSVSTTQVLLAHWGLTWVYCPAIHIFRITIVVGCGESVNQWSHAQVYGPALLECTDQLYVYSGWWLLCSVESRLTSEVLLNYTDQLYRFSGWQLLSGVVSQLTSEVLCECTDQLNMLSGSWLLSCVEN